MINFKFDSDGAYLGDMDKDLKEFDSPAVAVIWVAGCAALGFLIPFFLVLMFTNWLDPLFSLLSLL